MKAGNPVMLTGPFLLALRLCQGEGGKQSVRPDPANCSWDRILVLKSRFENGDVRLRKWRFDVRDEARAARLLW